ncbi:MAG: carbon-nitrogen hydrolase family protein [Myxococcota bacterium]
MKNPLRAAVVQAGSALFDTPGTLARFDSHVAAAADGDAELVVFPEAFIGGYPKGIDFGARMGMRSPEGRVWFQRYFDSAVELNGPEIAHMGGRFAEHGLHGVVGVIERDGGTLYCSAFTFDATGAVVNVRRKLMPTALERIVWGTGDGSTLEVAKTEIGRIGAAICWENFMPQLRLSLYGGGVELYCAPTVDDRPTWLPLMQTVAQEGRCYVLSACQHLVRGDGPVDYAPIQGDDPATVLIRGGSCIISPLGEVLAGPVFNSTQLLFADLDGAAIARGKYDFDVTGHYARPDVFTLQIDRRRRTPINSST